MSDLFRGGDITAGHPTTRNLAPAPEPSSGPTLPISATYPGATDQPSDVIAYGPEIPTEAQLRLLGNVTDTRVLLLGAGSGAGAVALARQGARVVAVDPTLGHIEAARAAADRDEVKVELHQSDLAELPFLRADAIDLAVSVYALAAVDDLDRLFRQVHRVLHPESHFVFSLPHPAYAMLDPDADPPTVVRSYSERAGRAWATGEAHGEERVRTVAELHTSLTRANFRVDTILEPEAGDHPTTEYWSEAMRWAPATLIVRARKEGI